MINGGGSTIAGSDDGFINGNGNMTALPAPGKITMVNGSGKPHADFLRETQVGRAAEGMKRMGSVSEVGSTGHRREESESVAESLAEELMGRLNTL